MKNTTIFQVSINNTVVGAISEHSLVLAVSHPRGQGACVYKDINTWLLTMLEKFENVKEAFESIEMIPSEGFDFLEGFEPQERVILIFGDNGLVRIDFCPIEYLSEIIK